jgi:hypothetical protein
MLLGANVRALLGKFHEPVPPRVGSEVGVTKNQHQTAPWGTCSVDARLPGIRTAAC